jgi:hypothetical protein
MTASRLLISAMLCAALGGCGGGGGGGGGDDGGGGVPPGADVGVSGSAEKGPFTVGSIVAVAQLAADGTSTEIGATETDGVLGDFDFDFEESALLELTVSGTFRNELDGTVSANEITLVGVAQLGNAPEQRVHVNVLTHLASARIVALLDQGQPAATAIATARDEVLAGLAPLVAAPAIDSFAALTIFGTDGDAAGNAYLLAITTFFYQYAFDQAAGGDVEAVLAALLDGLRDDLADGALDDGATLDAVSAGIPSVDPVRVTSVLENIASAVDEKVEIADINRFLDSDSDGVYNADDTDDDDDGVADGDDVFPYDPEESADFDGDGRGDNADLDDDDDGVLDVTDAFPFDDTESRDTDGDGVGNNTDPDDDADGSADTADAYPLDAACFRLEDGDGEACDIAATLPAAYTAAAVLIDGAGIVYLLDPANERIYRWSSAGREYLYPLHLDDIEGEALGTAAHVAYSAAHQRLYAGYDSGALSYFDILSDPILEQDFAALALPVDGLAAPGDSLLAQDASGVPATHHLYDADGNAVDSIQSHYSCAYDWNPALRRIYFFSDDEAPNDLRYETIGLDGTFEASGESPYAGEYVLEPPIRVSPDGNLVLVGSGNVFQAFDLTWLRALPVAVTDAQWLADDTIVGLRADGGATTLERWNALGIVIDSQSFEGAPVALLPSGDTFVVVTAVDRPEFSIYRPDN